MAKFCTECGKEIAQGVAFCTECGTKAPAEPETATNETVTEGKETKVAPPIVHTTPAQNHQAQQTYAQPQTSYAPPAPDPASKVVGTGAYFWLMLLFALPIIGQIACIIMAFAPKNKNIKHFARAQLIWMIIALLLIGILVAFLSVRTSLLIDFFKESTGGEFSNWDDIFSNLDELKGFIEQFENGGLENLPSK